MGLIGLLGTPMTAGIDLVLAGPQDFLAAPARWLDWISTFRATITGGPNFAYALAGPSCCAGVATSTSQPGGSVSTVPSPSIPRASRISLRPENRTDWIRFRVLRVRNGRGHACNQLPYPGAGMTVDTVDRRVLETESYAAAVDEGADHAAPAPAARSGTTWSRASRRRPECRNTGGTIGKWAR